ncbi:DUF3817 domain-containing protein [Streptomyces sp. NEAU-sy36]|uniref:DUF3817 domain-containing protein n=1 Tax=unclassified Streptomyces TaxID=2593676 RepID=UPI0015D5994F|nr:MULTISPECIES: DUF3817 domain-containing protein [unclassified Streptomyces]QLJ02630.1 DUF3817 domain-containing protein [Streptomyces sp. NEAU-sy36]
MRLLPPRHVRVAAHAELISLIVMPANLFTVHLKPVSSLMGPTHGCAYLFVVIATWRLAEATTAAKFLAAVPGAGGLLALRLLDAADPGRARPKEVIPS